MSFHTNRIDLAITKNYACAQVQLAAKVSIFSLLCQGFRGAHLCSNDLLFEDAYRGAEDQAELQGYIGEPLIRSTVDGLNDGSKYCLAIII